MGRVDSRISTIFIWIGLNSVRRIGDDHKVTPLARFSGPYPQPKKPCKDEKTALA